jgi:hypothetical protein
LHVAIRRFYITFFLHIFKEEAPGKTYLVLSEKMARADA